MALFTRLTGAVEFAGAAARDRVARYRAQASQFRELAEVEVVGRLRTQLLRLSREYDQLADGLEARSSRDRM